MTAPAILAIDPGTERSAWCYVDIDGGICAGIEDNDALLAVLMPHPLHENIVEPRVIIEQIESYGMPVGREVFETVRWTGRFQEAYTHRCEFDVSFLPRRAVKLHLCGSPRANDATIRQALLDRYGPGRAKAIGTKRSPGPLYGFKADMWSALALAVTARETLFGDAAPLAAGRATEAGA